MPHQMTNLTILFQSHHTHEIMIFKLFRGLQLQLSGVCGINLYYSHCFLALLTRIQLQEIISLGDFQSFFCNCSFIN